MSHDDLDPVRELVRAVMVTRGLPWGTFGDQYRTAQRFLDGEKVRDSSLQKLARALGISSLTFYFVQQGQWAMALDQPNTEDVRALIGAMIPADRRPRRRA